MKRKQIKNLLPKDQSDLVELCLKILSGLILIIFLLVGCYREGDFLFAVLTLIGFPFLLSALIALLFFILWLKDLPQHIEKWRFNKRFNWFLKHKEELPLSEEEKAMLCTRNRGFIGIDESFYKEMKQYVKHHTI